MQISNNFKQSTPAFGNFISHLRSMNPNQRLLTERLEEKLEDDGLIEQLDDNAVDIVAFANSPEKADKFDDGISVFFIDSFNGQAYRNNHYQMYSYSFDKNKLDTVTKLIKKLADKISSGKITAPAYDEMKLVEQKTDLDKLENKLDSNEYYDIDSHIIDEERRQFNISEYGDDYDF